MAIKIQHGGRGSDTAGQIIAQAGQGEANRQQRTLESLMRLAGSARAGPSGGGGGGGGGGAGFDEGAMERRRIGAQKAMATEKLRAQRGMQLEAIDAQAARDKQAADDATAKTALEFGLDEQVRQDEFDKTLQAKREEARMAANVWEPYFTPADQKEMRRLNNSNSEIRANKDNQWSPEEQEEMLAINKAAFERMQTSMKPADPSRYQGPEGQGPGGEWTDPKTGAQYRRGKAGPDGKLGPVELLLKKSETAEGIEDARVAKIKEAELTRTQVLEDAQEDRYDKRRGAAEDRFAGTDVPGTNAKGETIMRQMTFDEQLEAMGKWEQANPSPSQQRQMQEQAAIQQEQAAIQQQADAKEAEIEKHYQDQIDKLPNGTWYIAPDGSKRQKGASTPDKFVPWSERR